MKKEVFKQILEKNDENTTKLFSIYYVSLISSDTCIDTKSCTISLNKLKELKSYLNEFDDINEEIKKDYLEKINIGIEIIEQDLEALKNGNVFIC